MTANLQDLPEDKKKRIIIISVGLITTVIIISWLATIKNKFQFQPTNDNAQPIINQQEWEEFQQDLNELLQDGTQELNQTVDEINRAEANSLVSPTTTPSEQDLENLKQKLLELQNSKQNSN